MLLKPDHELFPIKVALLGDVCRDASLVKKLSRTWKLRWEQVWIALFHLLLWCLEGERSFSKAFLHQRSSFSFRTQLKDTALQSYHKRGSWYKTVTSKKKREAVRWDVKKVDFNVQWPEIYGLLLYSSATPFVIRLCQLLPGPNAKLWTLEIILSGVGFIKHGRFYKKCNRIPLFYEGSSNHGHSCHWFIYSWA